MIEFALPSLGADMDEGKLLEWKVAPGDAVKRGQVVAVVDTSKAAVDVEIWSDGVVEELRVQPGETIPVGTVMATLRESAAAGGTQGAAVPPQPSVAPVPPRPQPPRPPQPAQPRPPTPAPHVPQPAPAAEAAAAAGPPRTAVPTQLPTPRAVVEAARHPVSPAARHRARELGVDVDTLAGSGAGGAVTIADVEHAAAASAGQPPAAAREAAAPDGGAAHREEAPAPARVEGAAADRQREMRRAIAAAMSRSKREIPHYYLSERIPMEKALAWLARRNAERPITERILIAVVQLKAVALALRRTPELNGLFRDGEFVASEAVHTGVAIALRGGGLVAPAIHDVGEKPLAELMHDLADLVKRARAGSLRSSEMSDPTITVTNLGDQGVETVAGVIYPPQVAIVGFGRVVETAWAEGGWLRAVPVATASLAADHRVSDGHRGALFLAELHELLQRPEALDGAAD